MTGIYIALNRALDASLRPLDGLNPLWPLSVWAAIMGVAAMLIYKYTSSQAGIKDAKDRIKGHFYEVFLYIDDAPVIFGAQARIMLNAGRYLLFAMPPLVIMVALFFPLFANFETRYAFAPLKPGSETLVKVALGQYSDGWQQEVKLDPPPGVQVVAGPVRFVRKHYTGGGEGARKVAGRDYEADWRVRVTAPGRHDLKLTVRGKEFTVPLVGAGGPRPAPYATKDLGTALLYPPAVALPGGSPVRQVEIKYPEAEFPVGPWRMWWVWPFLVVSMAAAYAVKGVFKVEI